MREALNFHGFSKSDVIPITEPILFRRLFVGQQARALAGPTTIPRYRSMLDTELARRLGPPGGGRKLYVSRLRHHQTGSYYGETYVQKALTDEGFETIYPEEHPLTELVSILRNADISIFAEGSAIHALELCGSYAPATAVISRRLGSVSRFAPLLSDICGRWLISDRIFATAGLTADPKKRSGILNLPALARDLRSFADLSEAFSCRLEEMDDSIEQDVERHIADPMNERTPDYEAGAEQLRRFVRRLVAGSLLTVKAP